jgi:hypothetical protein
MADTSFFKLNPGKVFFNCFQAAAAFQNMVMSSIF